jgi:murein DD-endopeptidase MepM/ murein hydrolase activator NlpD
MKKFFSLFIFVLIGAGAVWIYNDGRAYGFLEREVPKISWVAKPEYIGYKPHKVVFNVSDTGAGISNVVVTARGEEKNLDGTLVSKELYRSGGPFASKTVSLVVDPKEFKVEKGRLTFTIEATDASIWENVTRAVAEVTIDREIPRLEVLTKHHYAKQGGTAVVMYRIQSDDVVACGVRYGKREFAGSLLGLFDVRFKSDTSAHIAIVPIDRSYDPAKEGALHVFARDKAGNEALIDFNQSIKPSEFQKVKFTLDKKFLTKIVPDLHPVYERSVPNAIAMEYNPEADTETLVTLFTHINKDLRTTNKETIANLATTSDRGRFFQGSMVKPMSAELTGAFGEERTFYLGSTLAGGSIHEGYDLANVLGAKVIAAAPGKVVFADHLGIYGNAVILDHGLGVQTLYGHLSTFAVKANDEVAQGAPIGTTGITGMAAGDHLHFETRVHGLAVDPKEWVDSEWIKTRFIEPMNALAN